MIMAILFNLSVCLLISVYQVAGITFREQPESATVTSGDTVTLHCSVNNQADIYLYWQNLDRAAYISINERLNPYDQLRGDEPARYSIIGDAARGEYHLQIINATKEDEGRYACVFFLDFNYYSQVAKLKVVKPPDLGYPKCTVEPLQRPTIGDNITLTCESRGGDPPSTLSWVRETTRLVTKRGRHSKGDPTVHYSMTLTENDSNVRFTCVANNPALQQPRTCSITPLRSSLNVLLRPVVASVEVGDSFTFVCITERMPNLVYQWYINNNPIDGRENRFTYLRGGQRLLIEAVTMEDDYALVKCEVTQKDYSYSGAAVGLLWVQSGISTPDIIETTAEPNPTTRRVSTKSLLTTLRATTTVPGATTTSSTSSATSGKATTNRTTTAAPPTTTRSITTTPFLPTERVADVLPIQNLGPIAANSGSSAPQGSSFRDSSSAFSSSYSSVSSLSEQGDGGQATSVSAPEGGEGTPDQPSPSTPDADVIPTEEVIVESETTPGEIHREDTNRTPSATTSTTTSSTTVADSGINNAIHAVDGGSSISPNASHIGNENSNIIVENTPPMPSANDTAIDNEIVVAGVDGQSTDILEQGSGDGLGNDSDVLKLLPDEEGPILPNEAGIGYKAKGNKGMPNWGLIAGLFVVFIIIVVALSALGVFLCRKHKQSKSQAST